MILRINPSIIGLLWSLVAALLLSAIFIPALKTFAISKGIVAVPNRRSSHSKVTPVPGGLAIYISSLVSIFIISILFDFQIELRSIFCFGLAASMMIILGTIDDMFDLNPYLKLIIQFISAFLIIESFGLDLMIYFSDSIKNSLGAQWFVFELSYLLSILIVILFINMINMIDGIDGLAGSLCLISCVFFTLTSILSGNLLSSLLCVSGIGSLIPFLSHNLFVKKKIFLGNNGSLLIGCVLVYLSLDFFFNNSIQLKNEFNNRFLLIISLFLYPLTDFIRIVTIRIFRLRNPLKADKKHIHHELIRSGLSHKSSTLVISILTILATFITYTLINFKTYIPSLFLMSMSFFISLTPKYSWIIRKIQF